MASSVRLNSLRRSRGLTEFLLDQLSRQAVFMDIDIISGVWNSRSMSRRQQWEGELVTKDSQAIKGKLVNVEEGDSV